MPSGCSKHHLPPSLLWGVNVLLLCSYPPRVTVFHANLSSPSPIHPSHLRASSLICLLIVLQSLQTMQQIYAISGTTKFVIYDIPTLGCLPYYRRLNSTYGCNPVANLVGDVHNARLRAKLTALQAWIPNLILLRLSGIFDDFVFSKATSGKSCMVLPSAPGRALRLMCGCLLHVVDDALQ